VRMMRIERRGWCERDWAMEGILMVATLPEAARRRCDLLSVEWDEAVKGDSQRGVRGESCSVWIICSILTGL